MMTKSKPEDKELTATLDVLLDHGVDREFRAMISRLYAVSSRLQAIRRELARHLGIGATEWAVLLTLKTLTPANGGMRINEVSDHLQIASANVTAAVNGLVSKHYVVKNADSRDSRAISVSLSSDGTEAMDTLINRLRDVNDRWFNGISPEEFAHANRFLDQMITNFDAALAIAKSR